MTERGSAIDFLCHASLAEPVGGAIETAMIGGHLSDQEMEPIARFLKSPLLDNRDAAMAALVYPGGRRDLAPEAVGLLISGVQRDDSDAYFAAIGYLVRMANDGDPIAARVVEAIRYDDSLREYLQML
jgi:hypothetical protein